MIYNINPMAYEKALAISNWIYQEPYSIYNMDGSIETMDELLDGSYFSVSYEDGELIGYYCFGGAAQVPIGRQFGAYDSLGLLDIGLGIRPDLCGRGIGCDFLCKGMDFAQRQFGVERFRLTVASFNKRAIRVYEKVGFEKVTSFERRTPEKTITFDIMIR